MSSGQKPVNRKSLWWCKKQRSTLLRDIKFHNKTKEIGFTFKNITLLLWLRVVNFRCVHGTKKKKLLQLYFMVLKADMFGVV